MGGGGSPRAAARSGARARRGVRHQSPRSLDAPRSARARDSAAAHPRERTGRCGGSARPGRRRGLAGEPLAARRGPAGARGARLPRSLSRGPFRLGRTAAGLPRHRPPVAGRLWPVRGRARREPRSRVGSPRAARVGGHAAHVPHGVAHADGARAGEGGGDRARDGGRQRRGDGGDSDRALGRLSRVRHGGLGDETGALARTRRGGGVRSRRRVALGEGSASRERRRRRRRGGARRGGRVLTSGHGAPVGRPHRHVRRDHRPRREAEPHAPVREAAVAARQLHG